MINQNTIMWRSSTEPSTSGANRIGATSRQPTKRDRRQLRGGAAARRRGGVLADNSEYGLYEIDRKLRDAHPGLPLRACYCDIRDRAAVDRLFAQERPTIVFHAAALKHLPLSEVNAREAVLTNVFGTLNVARASIAGQVAAMIQISTDKAAAPTSILGMTKRAAEAVCQMLDAQTDRTRLTNVRFHNVFASTGSVVPLFLEQLLMNRPLTVTDPAMTRYFMTGSKAARLLSLIAARIGSDEVPRGTTFVLDAGRPIAVLDLARRILADFGRDNGPSAIRLIGARPGEKLDECLVAPWERLAPTRDPHIARIDAPPMDGATVDAMLDSLARHCRTFDEEQLRAALVSHTADDPALRSQHVDRRMTGNAA